MYAKKHLWTTNGKIILSVTADLVGTQDKIISKFLKGEEGCG